ncbi:MAG: 16S rRNA (adenine(1518)-N(6)/adenine(1519)-N(6))-dimethyltransferase RsmA [Myxococcota bacterium]
MDDHRDTLQRFRAAGLRPKKSFGQNFLHDRGLARRIAERCTSPPGGTVLEIGAGLGALTRPLLQRAARVVAVERDRDLVPLLRETFDEARHVSIVEADAVRWDWGRAFVDDAPRPHVVAGNLPYQLSGRILERCVQRARAIDRAVFMLQREVVERLAAQPGRGARAYGVLSVFTQAAFSVEVLLRAPPGAFIPPPRVASAVVVLTPRASGGVEEDDVFRVVVKGAFAQRRKKLRNNWRSLFAFDGATLAAMAAETDVDLDARAETVDVATFARVADWCRRRRPDATR